MTVHILNQYVWPDCAPIVFLSEQLALCLGQNGFNVRLVGGEGSYRPGKRPEPITPIIRLKTATGRRGGFFSTLGEYRSVQMAFRGYIETEVMLGDIVICASAPPQTINLVDAISQRRAKAIYWLQDYYPDLLRGYVRYPLIIKNLLSEYWTGKLSQWDKVVKISTNIDYFGANSCVIRNWPTINFGPPKPFQPKTAYYFGNLGYGHSLDLFLDMCRTLRDDGFSITIIGDGPKVSKVPAWIHKSPSVDEQTLEQLHWQAEVHLVAADPEITGAIFPSKYWNSRRTERKIMTSGFSGVMLAELNEVSALTKLPSPADWLPLLQNL